MIGLHWVMALAIFANWILGLSMVDLPFSPRKLQTYSYHKWIGITLLGLFGARVAIRLIQGVPPLKTAAPQAVCWQLALASVAHFVLYSMMLFIPLSGWLFSSAKGIPVVYLGVLPLPELMSPNAVAASFWKAAHQIGNYAFMLLVAMHVLAAFKHHFREHDLVLQRMLPFLKSSEH